MSFKKMVVKSGIEFYSGVREEEVLWVRPEFGFGRTYRIVDRVEQFQPHWWEGPNSKDMVLMEIRDVTGQVLADPSNNFCGNFPSFFTYDKTVGLVFKETRLHDALNFINHILGF